MADKDQVKPLAVPSPPDSPETAGEDPDQWYLRRRRCLLWSCGCCIAAIVVFGLLIPVLAFTVFKVRDPVLTMDSIAITSFNLGIGSFGDLPVSINATLAAEISLENPNAASFGFGSSTTELYHGGETVGVAYAPAGRVGSRRTARIAVSVDVLADRVLAAANGRLLSGSELDLTSFTDIRGRVKVLGIFKRDIEVTMNCSIALEVSLTAQEIKSTECQANVW